MTIAYDDCGSRVPERVRERFAGNSNNGGDCDFWTCLTCFVPVLPDDRESHVEWHDKQDKLLAELSKLLEKRGR